MSAGRPSKYNSDLVLPIIEVITRLKGVDTDIAKALGVHRDTVIEWKKEHPEFADIIKKGFDDRNKEVQLSAYKKAIGGYTTKEVRTVYDVNGKKVKSIETVTEHPPDTGMICFIAKTQMGWRETDPQESGNTFQLTTIVLNQNDTVDPSNHNNNNREIPSDGNSIHSTRCDCVDPVNQLGAGDNDIDGAQEIGKSAAGKPRYTDKRRKRKK